MTLRPDTLAMTAVLAMLTALGPLSTDFYLPSLPEIARALGTDIAGAQATLSAFLFGFAAGQIVWGPLSDRLGRRPVLLIGLGLFLVMTLACAFAPSIEALIGARFAQALGASGPIVLGRAMVRDLYDGPRAGRELARMGMIMGLVPAVAPVVGGLLQNAFGWRSTFIATLLVGLAVLAVVATIMPETIRRRSPEKLSLLAIFRGFGVLLQNPAYRVYVSLTSLAYAGLFSFISGSSFVLIGIYGLTPPVYGLSFGCVVLGYILGTILAQRLVGPRGLDGVIALGVACLAGGGIAMLVCVASGFGGPLGVILPMAVYACGVGLTMPQSQAAAMMPFPDRAGAASSFTGLCQMLLSGCVGLLVGHLLKASALPLPLVMSAIGVAALALFRASAAARAQKR
ncbi:multidrug effflux MFS transporter [Bosea sp. (in: a-proteobacteria)]|jgi:DHA1 family bicyclomycin/chloramphenicol resistance-like MFS transporter|uniref:multidrug effflux MFS transporter n=1 Tax=Bosea sp. (in: a-proteobacteria) TaxID=1871050 RepID=UPI00086DB609|nr:multidrug effflux MFS transporter [Bosea sp. (in: a-proteobacteria)]MBN9438341.1 multidrug effflux MFS transporter [Bosea sp. (in: a-proteobacteria)]MBN9449790.1 multidrug effflux MFS transporter [Bosea sp. (in: a-proteobacteria)]ODT46803.1 MAG: multidrug transporter [Methylobacterium sp. SCN 67-24]